MPNPIAFLALAIFPVVVAALYGRLTPARALIWSLLLGYLFLPEPPAVFDLPLMPPLNKHNIPALAALAIALWRYGYDGPILPDSLIGKALVLTFVLSPILTVMTNEEAVFFGQIGLPGLGVKDALALMVQQFLLIVPFLLARQFLASADAQREMLRALMIGGLVYSVLMLIEVRLSPQLNNWIYGYFQHYFAQSIRFGGYRPVVFLYHGLWVAFFCMTAVVATLALWRQAEAGNRFRYLAGAAYLLMVLFLAKSLGAMIFAALLVPVVVLLGRRMQIRVALLIGLLAIGYPVLKGADLVPQDRLLAAAASIDPERAYSLQFRFDNENTLLERAYEKPVFGWGSWGRNHILDPFSGRILTVTDGRWIIVIGVYGWIGFLAEFGLLVLPILLLWRESALARAGTVSPWIAPLSLILAVNVFDMLPNATLTPLTWLIAGALTGYAEQLRRERLNLRRADATLKWKPIL
ncbi:hypothetical protein [Thetidibacter halocola]|uniref:O-antigen ligase domain-containing protein n=1 Tax=Thetidibacter halocola TaxID=2827239 RepID=A0A8J7W9N0_9RHOB|nr:hypothetical protein [Thetidibacter halocola]MBS0123520.1 hypothetical protein [Thetidibacter halocola]